MILCVCVCLLAGCRNIGPRKVLSDRAAYNHAIVNSWKEETLLNIVRLRYVDPTCSVDVSSVVGAYETKQTAKGVLKWSYFDLDRVKNSLSPELSLEGSLTNKPTISYRPQEGPEFLRNLATPVTPELVISLLEGGYGANILFRALVGSINGIKNSRATLDVSVPADPEFTELIYLFDQLQNSRGIDLRISKTGDGELKVRWITRNGDTEDVAVLDRIRTLLQLDPTAKEYSVVFGSVAENDQEIAMETRSLYRFMIELAADIDVPEEHILYGMAAPGRQAELSESLIHVRCSTDRPACPYASVCHAGHWFWIDNGDLMSKHVFSNLRLLLGLASTSKEAPLPVLTISAN